jgi:NADPH:quinone reductase-like Zn-dependent oxidoreductase
MLGAGASGVEVGEAVYGLIDFPHDGSAAEYAIALAADLAPKPRTLDHVRAAAVPLSALTAWQALFDHARLVPGGRVLIHGAAGGVGAYAVQLARARGIEVVATASRRHRRFVEDLGAATVVDYESTRFEDVARDVDAVLDTVGGDTRDRSWQTLRPGGALVTLTGPLPPGAPPRGDVRGIFFVVHPSRSQLVQISELIDAGAVRPFVNGAFPLSQGRTAFERANSGHLAGKIVLRVVDPGPANPASSI